MPPDTVIPLDRAHYDAIIRTEEAMVHVAEKVDLLADDVAELKARKCPCDTVIRLQSESDNLKGKFAVIVAAIGIVAGWIGSLIPNLFGRP